METWNWWDITVMVCLLLVLGLFTLSVYFRNNEKCCNCNTQTDTELKELNFDKTAELIEGIGFKKGTTEFAIVNYLVFQDVARYNSSIQKMKLVLSVEELHNRVAELESALQTAYDIFDMDCRPLVNGDLDSRLHIESIMNTISDLIHRTETQEKES